MKLKYHVKHQGYAKRELEVYVAPPARSSLSMPLVVANVAIVSGISAVSGCVPAVGRMCFGLWAVSVNLSPSYA